MLKRMSLVLMLLTALVGAAGVQAQKVAEPQSMAQYAPADADFFFAIRSDGAYLDELSGLVNGVVQKLPEAVRAQAEMLNLKGLLESQIGPLSETGVGDYLAISVSNTTVLYDQDKTNDSEAVVYVTAALADRAKFEAFVEKAAPNADKSEKDGATVYATSRDATIFVQDDAAFVTNQAGAFSGDTLADNSAFSGAISKLPEPNYNFVLYANFAPLFETAMTQVPEDSTAVLNAMGVDLSKVGPIAVGGTVLDEKSLVIDTYSPSLGSFMPMTGAIDPSFANNIPSGMNFVVHGTNLKDTLNSTLDLIYKINDTQSNTSTMPSREDINSQLKAFLGIDLDNDILGWMGGDYILAANMDMTSVLDVMEKDNKGDFSLEPRFVFLVQGDGSDKPAKVAQVIGNLLVNQTKNMKDAPKINLSSEPGSTTVVIEDIPVDKSTNMIVSLEIAGNKDVFLVGDKTTVDAILSGDGSRLSGDASYVEAQKYILPNASSVAFAGGDGWGDLISLFGVLAAPIGMSPTDANAQTQMDAQRKLLVDLFRSSYDIIGSSSLSVAYNEDGSQNGRAVLTLK